jgi:KaiC/GvpD/RAD55 family RecA-like ATPase
MKTRSFGIAVLDERLGTPLEAGVHALVGGPGTGKTVAALQFLNEAARAGGRVAFVTQARPEDVIERAASIGIDLDEGIRQGRWLLLGYQSGFKERYRRTIEPDEAVGELERLLGEEGVPDRLAIDTCGPLIESRESDSGAELLLEMVSRLGSTALLTFAGEHPGALDGGFELVSQRASLMLHLTVSDAGRRAMVVRKAKGPVHPMGPISFDIVDGHGMVPPMVQRRRSSDLSAEVRNRVLFVDIPGELPRELRQWLSEAFELVFITDPVDAFPELARREFGVVAIHVDRRTVDRGLHVMRQLRRAAGRPPILVMSPVDVRASDRAQALRAGADDFVSGGLNPDELASRIEALLRRSRVEPAGIVEREAPRPSTNGSERQAFGDLRELVRAQLRSARAPIFSLVILRPESGRGLHALAEHVSERMRRDAGDRVGIAGDRVEVYLHGAMASHAQRFVDRVRSAPFRTVDAEVYTAPTDRERMLEMVRRDG